MKASVIIKDYTSRIGAFQSNQAVNPFCQLSASVMDISRLRYTNAFNVFSKPCGPGSWANETELWSQCGTLALSVRSCVTFVTSAKGGVWFSFADFSRDAIGDLDRVC